MYIKCTLATRESSIRTLLFEVGFMLSLKIYRGDNSEFR